MLRFEAIESLLYDIMFSLYALFDNLDTWLYEDFGFQASQDVISLSYFLCLGLVYILISLFALWLLYKVIRGFINLFV